MHSTHDLGSRTRNGASVSPPDIPIMLVASAVDLSTSINGLSAWSVEGKTRGGAHD
jgi:hypothetical protein